MQKQHTYKQKRLLMLFVVSLTSLLVPTPIAAQKEKTTLIFKDGSVKTGLGKLTGNRIKFRTNKKEKGVKYDFSLLKEAKLSGKTYVSLGVKGKEKPKVLERLLVGKVYLYRTVDLVYTSYVGNLGGFRGRAGVGFVGGGQYYNIKNFYVRKKTENEVTHLGSNQLFTKNFKQAASNYFKDCPKLVKRIQNRALKKRDLKEIVQFYNNQCH